MGDHWRVSAMVTKLKDNEIDNVAELLKGFMDNVENLESNKQRAVKLFAALPMFVLNKFKAAASAVFNPAT